MITACGITLYHMCADEKNRMERYEKTYFPRASVYQRVLMNSRRSKDEPWRQRDTVIRIPERGDLKIALGDSVVLGSSPDDVPPVESLLVCGFADNRRGSRGMQHWKVVCR